MTKQDAIIVPVIMCGGAGTRLWPASRASFPKQFLSFGKELSLFQATVQRVTTRRKGLNLSNRPIVITGSDYRFLVAEQLQAIGAQADIVLEPCRRDSAPAIAAATQVAQQRGDDVLVFVLAADHAVPDTAAFLDHVAMAVRPALDDWIVTFGIRPSSATSDYGYIAPGKPIGTSRNLFAIRHFVEKPDLATAERYVAEGYLWNSGNFLFKASALITEISKIAPDVYEPAKTAVEQSVIDQDFIRLESVSFATSSRASFDCAMMEKTERAAVLQSEFEWSDVGSWRSVHEFGLKDSNGNVVIGNAVLDDTLNSIVHAENGLTAVIGLRDVLVVSTRDVVLVAPIAASSEVKKLVELLESTGRREATEHTHVHRPWGSYESLEVGCRYQIKRISVLPGGKLSLQSHVHRAEHWVVVSGTARVTVGNAVELLTENQAIHVPVGAVHRLENPGKVDLHLIEVQCGTYLGEDDIIRYEDLYNRQEMPFDEPSPPTGARHPQVAAVFTTKRRPARF